MSLNIDDTYTKSGTFLKAADLQKKRVNLTIAGASLQELQDGQKIVLDFEATDKQLVLNKTNANMICDLLGTRDAMLWIGSTITLRPDKTQLQDGKIVDCIRVDFELPPQKNAQAQTAAAGQAAPNTATAHPLTPQTDGIPNPTDDDIPF